MLASRIPFFPIRTLLALTACAVAPAIAQPSAPESDASISQLTGIRVTGNATLAPLSTDAGAAKTDTPILQAAQSITVIDRDTMDALGASSTAEAVRYSAGVGVGGFGTDSRVDEISLRGFRTGSFANNVYRDGLRPIGSSSGPTAVATQFDGYGLERVEIVRGPASVLYGQIAPGGLVNTRSKRPSEDVQGEISLGTDNYGLARLNADVGGAIDEDGRWLYRVVGVAYHTETQVDHVELNRLMLAPSLTWRIAPATSLTLLLNWQQDRGGTTYQFLPADGTYTPTAYGRFGSKRFLGEPGFNRYDRTQYSAGYELTHAVSDALKIEQKLRYMRVDTDNVGVNRRSNLQPDGRTLLRNASANLIRAEGLALDNMVQWRVALGQTQHTVLTGLDYRRQGIRVASANGTVGAIDVFEPVYGSPVVLGSIRPSRRSSSEQTGVYLQDQIAWQRWIATAALRHDWSHDATLIRMTNARSGYSDTAFTGRAGLLYQFAHGFSPYISYATSFEPVNAVDWHGAQFKPSKGKQLEAGIKFQRPGSRSALTFSVYEIHQENILTPDPDPTHLCEGRPCSVQSGEGRVRGVELEANVVLTPALHMMASATFMDSKVTKSNGPELGKQLPRVPRQNLGLWLNYQLASGLNVSGGVRYASSSYGDNANSYATGALTLFDAGLRYDLGQLSPTLRGVQFALNATNLADKEYISSCSGPTSCYYGARRAVSAHVRYSW